MRVLALESSTTSAKAMLYDTGCGVVRVCTQPYASQHNHFHLTGVSATTASTASGGGLIRLDTGDYDLQTLEEIGITRAQLPLLRSHEETAPLSREGAALLGLKAGIPVLPPLPDGALNQAGAAALPTLTGNQTGQTLYYGVMQGVLLNLYQCYRILCGLNGGEPETIHLSGGILRSPPAGTCPGGLPALCASARSSTAATSGLMRNIWIGTNGSLRQGLKGDSPGNASPCRCSGQRGARCRAFALGTLEKGGHPVQMSSFWCA